MRESSVERAADRDCLFVADEGNGLLAEHHLVVEIGILGKVGAPATAFLEPVDILPGLRLGVGECSRRDAYHLAVAIVGGLEGILTGAQELKDGKGDVRYNEIDWAFVRGQWMEVDIVDEFGDNNKQKGLEWR